MLVGPKCRFLQKINALQQFLQQNPNPLLTPRLELGLRLKKNPYPRIRSNDIQFHSLVKFGETIIFCKFHVNLLMNKKVIIESLNLP